MITRRRFLQTLGVGALASAALGSYAFAVEPLWRLAETRYRLKLPAWRGGPDLRIAVLSDFHFCEPWMTVERVARVVERTHALEPDLILLPGDFAAGMRWVTEYVHSSEWAPLIGTLRAPLGVYAVQGNHDWWEDADAQRTRQGPTFVDRALTEVGVPLLKNAAIRLEHGGRPFWLAGLEDQLAFIPYRKYGRTDWQGLDDLDGTLAQITDDAPVILMAHEPDIFPKVPERVALTISGHTHGGQVRLFGHSPVVPSRYGNRFAYGHVVEDGRSLLVSGGLGCSIAPVRFGVPPEIVVIELSGA